MVAKFGNFVSRGGWPMRGVVLVTGSMSPTMVPNSTIANSKFTPGNDKTVFFSRRSPFPWWWKTKVLWLFHDWSLPNQHIHIFAHWLAMFSMVKKNFLYSAMLLFWFCLGFYDQDNVLLVAVALKNFSCVAATSFYCNKESGRWRNLLGKWFLRGWHSLAGIWYMIYILQYTKGDSFHCLLPQKS